MQVFFLVSLKFYCTDYWEFRLFVYEGKKSCSLSVSFKSLSMKGRGDTVGGVDFCFFKERKICVYLNAEGR